MADRMNDLTGKEWLQNSFTIWRDIKKNREERQLKHPAMYPIVLCKKLIRIFTRDDGEEVVIDPFMGIGSTVLAAKELGRKGIGIELSEEFYKITKHRVNEPQQKLIDINEIEPELHLGDSRDILKQIPSESVDLCINSPPYWDILNQKRTADKKDTISYSDSKVDIGNIANYEEFLEHLKLIYTEIFRILKPNKRCCTIVMDIRKKDKFFPLHIDITRVMEEIGYELEEFVIWDRQHEYNNMKTLGYPYVFRFNKVHEFICVYLKRDKKKKRYYKPV